VVTPFVEGTDLERWIADGPHLPSEILALFRQMAAGVAAAHAAGLSHRNLKPGTVLIGRDAEGKPQVRIADFLLGKVRQAGPVAAVTQMGTTFGTPQYMSPEQFRGAASVDERGDLFALGCLLYEMATGTRAFQGTGLIEIYTAVAKCDYRPLEEVRPGLPSWVSEILSGLLKPDPAERIPSATALLEKLDAADATADAPTVDRDVVSEPEPELTEPGPELTDVKGNADGRALKAAATQRLVRPAVVVMWLAVLGGLGFGIAFAVVVLAVVMFVL
jgi:serine/threonine protein kinase